MIIIGIDPGIATTGYGIVQRDKRGSFVCLDYGVIETKKEISTPKRLYSLYSDLSFLIKKYSPDFLSVENIYFFKNTKSVIAVSQAKGVIMLTAEKLKTPVYEFTPLQIKMTITGYGKADKNQVQEMIKMTLNLKEIPKPDDAADAIGVAICGIIRFENSLLLE
jgi:crossover junction endodeoxyribonuclease RuvC